MTGSPAQYPADHTVDVGLGHRRVERQRKHPGGYVLRRRELATAETQTLAEVRRQVHRDKVNARPDAKTVKVLGQLVSSVPGLPSQAQRVQMPCRAHAGLDGGQLHQVTEAR